jgi:hypothetical protein
MTVNSRVLAAQDRFLLAVERGYSALSPERAIDKLRPADLRKLYSGMSRDVLKTTFSAMWEKITEQERLTICRTYRELRQTEREEADGGAHRVARAVSHYFSPLRTSLLAVTLLATIGTIACTIALPAPLRVLGGGGSLLTGAALTYSIVTPSSNLSMKKPPSVAECQEEWIRLAHPAR